tara:strand:+ start:364 stop:627 length:264 start_codon:yes stop_codon:yes gene_type:complete
MSDPLIRAIDDYVAIVPGQTQTYLDSTEILDWLEEWVKKIEFLPKDLEKQKSTRDAAQYLLDTACDLEISPGFKIQWFAIRLDPPDY